MITKVRYTLDEIDTLTEKLAKQIKEDRIKIDYIVALSKGGLIPARLLAKYLAVKKILVIGIEFYKGMSTMDIPHIYQKLSCRFNGTDNILIVDDIVDTGESIKAALSEVIDHGGQDIITASLHYKNKASYMPLYYGELVSNEAWVIYPWENDVE